MQYVSGLGSFFKRVILPLVSKGVKLAAPNLVRAAMGVGKDVLRKAFKRAAMAQITPHLKSIKKRNVNKKNIPRKKFKGNASENNIF